MDDDGVSSRADKRGDEPHLFDRASASTCTTRLLSPSAGAKYTRSRFEIQEIARPRVGQFSVAQLGEIRCVHRCVHHPRFQDCSDKCGALG